MLYSSAITWVGESVRGDRRFGNHLACDVTMSSQEGLTVMSAHPGPFRWALGQVFSGPRSRTRGYSGGGDRGSGQV